MEFFPVIYENAYIVTEDILLFSNFAYTFMIFLLVDNYYILIFEIFLVSQVHFSVFNQIDDASKQRGKVYLRW